MATIKSANVTKYDAGGSGDNIVADGMIKSVEKVWLDTYTVSSAIATTSSLCIARIPANKKITDIVVHLPVLSAAATATTIYACTGATTAVTTYFGKLICEAGVAAQTATIDCGTAGTVRLNGASSGMLTALPADTGIFLMINPATTITGGTIRTIVRYT